MQNFDWSYYNNLWLLSLFWQQYFQLSFSSLHEWQLCVYFLSHLCESKKRWSHYKVLNKLSCLKCQICINEIKGMSGRSRKGKQEEEKNYHKAGGEEERRGEQGWGWDGEVALATQQQKLSKADGCGERKGEGEGLGERAPPIRALSFSSLLLA